MSPVHQPYVPSPSRLSPSALARIGRRIGAQSPWRRHVRFTQRARRHARVAPGQGDHPAEARLPSWPRDRATQLHRCARELSLPKQVEITGSRLVLVATESKGMTS